MEKGYKILLPGRGKPSNKPLPPPSPSQQTLQDGDTLLALTVVTPSGHTTESTESLTHTPETSKAGDTSTSTSASIRPAAAAEWATRRDTGTLLPLALQVWKPRLQPSLPHPPFHPSAQGGRKLNCNVRAGRSAPPGEGSSPQCLAPASLSLLYSPSLLGAGKNTSSVHPNLRSIKPQKAT